MNSLPKTVTRQRRDCDLNPDPTAPESSTLTTRLPSHPDIYIHTYIHVLLLLLLLLHPVYGLFSGTTWVSRYRKRKTGSDLKEARDDRVSGWK